MSAARNPAVSITKPDSVLLGDLDNPQFAAWDDLVRLSPQGTVFCYSWWLRAVSEKIRLIGYFEDGRLIAALPLYDIRKYGLRVCAMPPGTPFWGVMIKPLEGKPVALAAHEMHILQAFASALAREQLFYQCFHPTLRNWLPFYWNGFRQTLRFTYRLDDLANLDAVWSGLAHTTRGDIRKAEKRGLRVVKADVSAVCDLERMTFGRQGLQQPRDREFLEKIYRTAEHHGSAACYAVAAPDGRLHAATMLVWDARSAYPYAGGADPECRDSGGVHLLMWELIRFAAERTTAFDFAGSMMPGIDLFNRSFGPRQVPYNAIMRFPIWVRACLMLRGKL